MSCEILNFISLEWLYVVQACSNLNNNGTCVDACPAEKIIVNGALVDNPAFRLEAGTQCIVPPCPGKWSGSKLCWCSVTCMHTSGGLFRLGGQCLRQYPNTHQSIIGGECVMCEGTCPRGTVCEWVEPTVVHVSWFAECPGGTVTGSDPNTRTPFINCTVITGNLVVSAPPVIGFKWVRNFIGCSVICFITYSADTLNILNTIQEIRGTLSIEQWTYPTFPYLSNLHILGSNLTNLHTFPSECANGSSVHYALFISNNNNLTSIDLSSLREIKGGGFYLSNNLQLCLIGNFSSIMTNTFAPVCVTTQARRDPQQCGETTIWCWASW